MSAALPVAWLLGGAPAVERGPGAAVWITSAAETAARPRPRPDADDRADAAAEPAGARADFLHRRGLLRTLVASRLGGEAEAVSIRKDGAGAPRLRGSATGTFVSSARRDGWIALAVAPCPVGVDLERAQAPGDPAWAVLAPRERADLLDRPASERGARFLRLWTAKEAYLKALGTGLARDPATVAVRLEGEGFALDDDGRPVRLAIGRHWWGRVDGAAVLVACTALPVTKA